jgi:thiamine biosynthesis lipoprotein
MVTNRIRIALPPTLMPAPPPTGPIVRLGGATMGTCWSIAYALPGLAAERVRSAIETRLADLIAQLSQWEVESALARFNRAPAGSWHILPPDFVTVIAAALEMVALSGGAFDPAIGRLTDLHGFGPPGPQPAPAADAILTARGAGGAGRLAFDPAARRLRQPGGLALDFSGIGKGHAVDALGAVLDGLGARDWLVEIGGELKGRGMRPDAEPWWVDLETPPGGDVAPLRLALHGLAVATSGDYVRGAHTLDPFTGRPVANGVRSVSVIHASAMWADAWATALTVLGPTEGLRLADAHGVAARIVDKGEHLSVALRAMLHQ